MLVFSQKLYMGEVLERWSTYHHSVQINTRIGVTNVLIPTLMGLQALFFMIRVVVFADARGHIFHGNIFRCIACCENSKAFKRVFS